MILVDSHCHLDCLDLSKYNHNLKQALAHASEMDVGYFLCVCITQNKFSKMQKCVNDFPNVFVSVGTHPNEVLETEPDVEEMLKFACESKVVAIGETGLDYYRTSGDVEWQRDRFRHHIHVAKEIGKPLIVHSRNAREDTIKLLKKEQADHVGGVLHCFTEDWEMAQQALDLNFYISFSGIVTFQNAKELCEVVKKVPLSKMLIETDSPYLAPIPFRGQCNEPAYVRFVAEKIAELKEETLDTVAEVTTQNFFELFEKAKYV